MKASDLSIMANYHQAAKLRFFLGNTFQVLVWFLLCAGLIILIWYLTQIRIDSDKITLEEKALHDVSSYSQAYASYVSQKIEAIDQISLQIKLQHDHLDEKSIFVDLIESGMFRNTHIVQVLLVDRDGIVRRSLFEKTEKVTAVSDQSYFRFHKNDSSDILLMGKPTTDHLSGRKVITFSRRLGSLDKSFDGLVVVLVDTAYLTSFYAGSNPGKSGLLAVVGADGTLRSAKIGERSSLILPDVIPLFDTHEGTRTLKGESWVGDKLTRYIAWKTLETTPLIVIAGIPEQQYLAPYQKAWTSYRQVAVSVSVFLVIFALLAAIFSIRLARKNQEDEEVRKTYRIATEGGNEGFYMYHALRDNNEAITDFELVDCNQRGADFYGISKKNLLGEKLSDLYHASYFTEMKEMLSDAMESGFYEDERRFAANDPLTIDWGKIRLVRSGTGLAVTVQNISERKKNEEALRESEKRLRLIHSQVPGIVYQFKVDKDGNRSLPYVSPAIENYIGRSAEMVMKDAGKWFELAHPEDYPDLEKTILDSLNNMSIWEWEGRFIRDDGETVWLRGNSTPEKTGDGGTLWNGLFIDVTERRSQEELLRRTQKMDALGRLSGGIAHDYNNILGIVLGYAEQIQANKTDSKKIEDYAKHIVHSAERGAMLAKKLLTFSRYKQPDTEIININTLLKEQQHMLEKILTSGHKLTLDLADNLWSVELNSSDLEDAIVNMCINAMHAMKQSGQLTIKTSNEQFKVIDARHLGVSVGDYVQLSITDTGSGMDEMTREKIFDPFFTTKGDQGTGLGLSQVYGFIERSGGTIKVYSELGHGSRFALYLPKSTKVISETENIVIDELQNINGNETLLVVDDEEAMADLAFEMLSAQGYHVLTANDGEQALALLKHEKVDLIISDVIMPNMDGFQLAKQVRQHYPNIKIQIVSGFSDNRNNDEVDKSLHENMLNKPYSAKVLLARVRQILDESKTNIDTNKCTVLILDDDETIQSLYKIKIEALGYKVLQATDGSSAIELYKQSLGTVNSIDIIIVDLSIPGGIGGKEVAKELRIINPQVKIIVSSGNVASDEMLKPHEHGFDGALEKNFNAENIKRILKQVATS